MFASYFKIATRTLLRFRLYAAINILGLALGLAVYLLSGLITDYERNHDHMFENRDRIYTVASIHNPERGHSNVESNTTYLALTPLINASNTGIRSVRSLAVEGLIRSEETAFYDRPRFVDDGFFDLFNFDYVAGAPTSMSGPNQAVLTESSAMRYFGSKDVVGQNLTLVGTAEEVSLQVVAVIKDVAVDSHFNSNILDRMTLGVITHIKNLDKFFPEIDPDQNWGWLSSGFATYLMTDGKMSLQQVNELVNQVFLDKAPLEEMSFISSVVARPLAQANQAVWYEMGFPVIDLLDYLGLMVLLVAIINYANLATAQNMGRFREVGLRKTLGASRQQLLVQFLLECQTIVFIALLLALAFVELFVPLFNQQLGKVLTINYLEILPWLLATTIVVGLCAGLYPAYLITNANPSEAIKNQLMKSGGGARFRAFMIGTQFAISIILLSMVLVVTFQNNAVEQDSEIFPKSQVMVINKVNNDAIIGKSDVFVRQVEALPDVVATGFSSQVPFDQQNWNWTVSRDKGDRSNSVVINNMNVSPGYLETYDIPIVAGRNFTAENPTDQAVIGPRGAKVLVNELAARTLGFATNEEALGQTFYVGDLEDPYELRIIGVMADRNMLGLQNRMRPFTARWRDTYNSFSIKLRKGASAETVDKIQQLWKQHYPDFPIEWNFLDKQFDDQFAVMRAAGSILAGFAMISVFLALFGLFGLAAFMARGRTREIGIRKVMGASLPQIVRMLLWQFSTPVFWAILVALPFAYYASDAYLNFFAQKINTQIPLILVAGAIAVLFAMVIISVHAIKVAKSNPIKALRYE